MQHHGRPSVSGTLNNNGGGGGGGAGIVRTNSTTHHHQGGGPSSNPHHLGIPPSSGSGPIGVREGAVRIDQQPLAELKTSTSYSASSLIEGAAGGGGGTGSRNRSTSALSRRSGENVEMTQVVNGNGSGVKSLPPPPLVPDETSRDEVTPGVAR